MSRARTSSEIIANLLRDERVAVAAYQALETWTLDPEAASEIRGIKREHQNALALMEEQANGVWEQADDAGAWEAWAPAIEAGAHHRRSDETLRALKAGEKRALDDFERALSQEAVSFELRDLIAGRILPRMERHLAVLERLLGR